MSNKNEYHILKLASNFNHKEITYWNKIFKIAWKCYSCLFDKINSIVENINQIKSQTFKLRLNFLNIKL